MIASNGRRVILIFFEGLAWRRLEGEWERKKACEEEASEAMEGAGEGSWGEEKGDET